MIFILVMSASIVCFVAGMIAGMLLVDLYKE